MEKCLNGRFCSRKLNALSLLERLKGAKEIYMGHMQKTKCPPSKPIGSEMHDKPEKQGVTDSKEGQQRQGAGTLHDTKGTRANDTK
jgi:hypothetical protein